MLIRVINGQDHGQIRKQSKKKTCGFASGKMAVTSAELENDSFRSWGLKQDVQNSRLESCDVKFPIHLERLA
jgi:hypothetical protein